MPLKIASNVTLKGGRSGVSAFIDGAYLGRVYSGRAPGVFVELYGKVFKAATDPRDQEIADLKASNERLADALDAAKERAGDKW